MFHFEVPPILYYWVIGISAMTFELIDEERRNILPPFFFNTGE